MENLNIKKLLNEYEDVYKPSPFKEELGITKVQNHVSQILVCDVNSFEVIVISEGILENTVTWEDGMSETEDIVVGVKKYSKYFDNIENALRCKTELKIDDTWKEEFTVDRIDFLGYNENYEELDDDEKDIHLGPNFGLESYEEDYLQYNMIDNI